MPSASTFEAQAIGGAGGEPATGAVKQNTTPFFSQSPTPSRAVRLMYLVSVANGGPVDLQVVKKVIATKGQYKDYANEIWQSYELGFTPYCLHTNEDGTFVTPIRVYDWRVYVLDDVATVQVTTQNIATDKISSKLVYFVEADDGSCSARRLRTLWS